MAPAFATRSNEVAIIETLQAVAGNRYCTLPDADLARLMDALGGYDNLPSLARLGIALIEHLHHELQVAVAQRGAVDAAHGGRIH
jgi:hypothetical protein